MSPDSLLEYGIIGIAALSFIGSSIIPLPMVPVEALVALGYLLGMNIAVLYFAIVVSSTLGGYTTYYIGGIGSRFLKKFDTKKVEKTREHLDKWGSLYVIASSTLFFIPYDIVALLCGVIRMNKIKFLVATLIGKIIRIAVVFAVLLLGTQQ